MQAGTLHELHEQDAWKAGRPAAALQGQGSDRARNIAQAASTWTNQELEARHRVVCSDMDTATRHVGTGTLSDGSWLDEELRPEGAALQFGHRLAASTVCGGQQPPWVHTDHGCTGPPWRRGTVQCGWREGLSQCRWCYAWLCEWHRASGWAPDVWAAQPGMQRGGASCQCSDREGSELKTERGGGGGGGRRRMGQGKGEAKGEKSIET